MFVHAGVENIPHELYGIATSITVLLPWGTLLKAVAKPDLPLLNEIKKLAQSNIKANLKVIFGYDTATEQKQMQELGLPDLTSLQLDKLVSLYSRAGFNSIKWRWLPQDELKTIPSTWAKKLAYGKKRQFVELICGV